MGAQNGWELAWTADWIVHAKIVARSWDGERVEAIAQELDCSPQIVRRRLHRFDAECLEGLGDRTKAGHPRRLTAEDGSRIIALARSTPPGKLKRFSDGSLDARDEQGAAHWSLDALAQAAQGQASRSIAGRSVASACMRRSVGVGRTVGEQRGQRLCPKGTAVVSSYTAPPKGSTTICTDELGPILPRSFPPVPGWSADGHRIKAPLE